MQMVKKWLTALDDRPGSHVDIILNIQQAHGQKMMDSPPSSKFCNFC